MNKNIIIYANYSAPYSGNFLASIYELEDKLQELSVSVIYMLPEHALRCEWVQNAILSGKTIEFISDNPAKNITKMCYYFRKYNPSSVYTHFINRKQLFSLKLARRIANCNFVVVEHFHNHYVYDDGFVKQALKRLIIANDALIGCSKDVKNSFLNGHLTNNLLGYAENGLDFSRLNSWVENTVRERFHILMFGFDVKRKGVDIAVNACLQLRNKYSDIVLDICLSRNRDLVESEIRSILGFIPDWINILPAREDVATYYRNADLFISPSREEGFCYSIIEASYCHIISVASRIPGQYKSDMLGIEWHEPNSSDDLAIKIEKVYRMSTEEYFTTANLLAQQAYSNYGLQKWVSEVISFLREAKAI